MKTLAIAAIAAAAAAPALAGGPVMTAPEPVIAAPAAVYAPVGEWTGAYAGVHLGYGHGKAKIGALRGSGNGALGGIDAGYRHDFGQFVLGGELSYTDSNADFDTTGKFRDTTDLKLVAGYDAGKTLVYGTLGPSYGRARLGNVNFKDGGFVFGVGVDYAVTDHVTVGGELLHRRYNDFDNTGFDVSGTSLEAKVGYKF